MKPTQEHLAIINSRLPGTKLGTENVEILPFRVFDNAVTDRFTIMSAEMMAKIAQDLNDGKAAFNSMHQSRTTLPVGRSVNSRLVTSPDQTKEVHANMYAVVKNLDGSIAAEGKDLADRYNTGAVYACSAGVTVGFYKCNICGNDIRDWNKCDHIPGHMYSVNEQPKQCIALMTGRQIENGVAMDCGIYEVSAVTAGGVANAGVLTETFGQYTEGADAVEFKKTAFSDKKEIETRISFTALHSETQQERNNNMALEEKDVQRLIDAQFGTIVADKAKLEVEYKHLEEKYQATETKLQEVTKSLDTTKAEFEAKEATLKAEFEAKEAEFAKEKDALLAEKDAYEAEKANLEAFKAEYIATVEAAGNKVDKKAEYATKTLDELKELNVSYANELNVLYPTGRQSLEDTHNAEYAGLPASVFKTDK